MSGPRLSSSPPSPSRLTRAPPPPGASGFSYVIASFNTDLQSITSEDIVHLRMARLRQTTQLLATQKATAELVVEIIHVTHTRVTAVEPIGTSAIGMPSTEIELRVCCADANANANVKVKVPGRCVVLLNSLEKIFSPLCDPGSLHRNARDLRFAMLGSKFKLEVSSTGGSEREKAGWQRCVEDPLVRSISILAMEDFSADPLVSSGGFTPWVTIGLAAVFVAHDRLTSSDLNQSPHEHLARFYAWMLRTQFSLKYFRLSDPQVTYDRTSPCMKPLSLYHPVFQGVDLARDVTHIAWTRVQDLSRALYLELTSKKPMSNPLVALSPQLVKDRLAVSSLTPEDVAAFRRRKLEEARNLVRPAPSAPRAAHTALGTLSRGPAQLLERPTVPKRSNLTTSTATTAALTPQVAEATLPQTAAMSISLSLPREKQVTLTATRFTAVPPPPAPARRGASVEPSLSTKTHPRSVPPTLVTDLERAVSQPKAFALHTVLDALPDPLPTAARHHPTKQTDLAPDLRLKRPAPVTSTAQDAAFKRPRIEANDTENIESQRGSKPHYAVARSALPNTSVGFWDPTGKSTPSETEHFASRIIPAKATRPTPQIVRALIRPAIPPITTVRPSGPGSAGSPSMPEAIVPTALIRVASPPKVTLPSLASTGLLAVVVPRAPSPAPRPVLQRLIIPTPSSSPANPESAGLGSTSSSRLTTASSSMTTGGSKELSGSSSASSGPPTPVDQPGAAKGSHERHQHGDQDKWRSCQCCTGACKVENPLDPEAFEALATNQYAVILSAAWLVGEVDERHQASYSTPSS